MTLSCKRTRVEIILDCDQYKGKISVDLSRGCFTVYANLRERKSNKSSRKNFGGIVNGSGSICHHQYIYKCPFEKSIVRPGCYASVNEELNFTSVPDRILRSSTLIVECFDSGKQRAFFAVPD